MVEGAGLPQARAVLEYGPGTGAFTEMIRQNLKPDARFAAIELNSRFADLFQQRFPDVILVRESVSNVREICDGLGIANVDSILSGLPWATFSTQLQTECMDAMMKVLGPGGRFATFCYVHSQLLPAARQFANLLPKYFKTVSASPIVWLNMPPAFVYRCRR